VAVVYLFIQQRIEVPRLVAAQGGADGAAAFPTCVDELKKGQVLVVLRAAAGSLACIWGKPTAFFAARWMVTKRAVYLVFHSASRVAYFSFVGKMIRREPFYSVQGQPGSALGEMGP